MPYQNVETSSTSVAAFSTTTNQDYNLGRLSNTNPANGVSIQVIYTFLTATSAIIKLQASNDGTNFADISGSSVTVTVSGNTLWDVGTPHYKILRVVMTPTGGTISAVLVLNATNLS